MRWLSDETVSRLRRIADWPDVEGTRYRLVEPIGRGGMGTVFAALDKELDREVALKVLDIPGPAVEASARMLREARVLARLEHPGIVPVHDVGTLPDGRVFYAMKRVRGTRLDEHAATLGSARERVRLLTRICEAVGFAHAHGVIHRDLKPENIMVGAFGEVLVMDWGVAKLLDRDRATPGPARAAASDPPRQPAPMREGRPDVERPADQTTAPDVSTAEGTVIGTPAYMAPEQARGDVARIDGRTDVFGLGAILFFLLRGYPPGGRAPRDGTLGGGSATPRALEAIRAMAMASEPADRYPHVRALADDLERFLAGGPVAAFPEGLFLRTARLATKHRTPILLVSSYLVMRLAIFLWGRR